MLTPEKAAKILGVTEQTIRVWIKTGKIAYVKVGARYRLTEEAVNAMLIPHNAKNADRS